VYHKILVPLDGSKLAECALPHAISIAKAYGAELILVSVTEVVEGFRVVNDPSTSGEEGFIPEAGGKLEKQARNYLDKIVKKIEKDGIQVTTEVPYGKPAEEIMASANLYRCDLVVMSSHGRSGVSKWTHGSVADKVLRGVKSPVLIIRAGLCKD
jgi:nucleotide-binding universal stress UspA family protein